LPSTTPAQLSADSPPGYEIVGELGRGGMGVVYKARQVGLNRPCALKMILSGGHAGADDLQRFRTESEAIARLQHPNIVAVYEVGQHNGKPFFSLEFCAGGNLDRKLAGSPSEPTEAAALVRTLALAIQAAHEANVIHRDLKPANVLLTADGTPKITDFGLAKKLDDESRQTQTGAIMGTPSYMAPEQAEGSKAVGPLADVYALGAILYEMLTGRPPFKAATSFDTITQVVSDDPIPPSRLRSATPRDLETICLKCLHKDPAKRYASAQALADDLGRFLDGKPVLARPISPLARAWRWCRRNRAVASSLAGVFLILAVATVVSLSAAASARHEKGRADEKALLAADNEAKAKKSAGRAIASENRAKKSAAEARTNEARANDRLVRLHVATALHLVDEGDLLGALPWLAEAIRRDRDPRRVELHRRRFAAVLRRCPRLVNLWTTNVYDAHPSPAGTHVLVRTVGDGYTSLVLLDAFTGKALHKPLRVPMRTAVKFSPDGSRYLTIEDHLPKAVTLQLRDTLTGKPAGPPLRLGTLEVNASFTSDGKRLLTVHIENRIERHITLWDLATGRDVTPDEFRAHRPEMFMRAMDGDLIATLSKTRDRSRIGVQTWALSRGKPIGRTLHPARDEAPKRFAGAVAPDGSRFMISSGRVATVYDMAVGTPVAKPFRIKTAEEITHAHMFLGGARLVTVTAGGTHWWDARSGELLHTWRRGREGDEEVDFSDDGRLVLFHNNATTSERARTRIWDWQADEPASPLLRHAGPISARKFLPDGRRFLTLHRSGSDLTRGDLCLWDLVPAPPPPPWPCRAGPIAWAASASAPTARAWWRRLRRGSAFTTRPPGRLWRLPSRGTRSGPRSATRGASCW
jgi:hypothetical protein